MELKEKIFAGWIIIILLILAFGTVQAQEQEEGNKTLSPYFFIKSDDPQIDRLPLKSTDVRVTIAGVIADVAVTQTYQNDGKRPLEATYIFPASTRAAVYGMKMIIGERTIVAKIKKRDEARRVYEKAKEKGRTASLLEQQRPNVFQMNVANILPKDMVKVELRYTELLIPEEKVYSFVYPTVVGPRYSEHVSTAIPVSNEWVRNPYLHEGDAPTSRFFINVTLSSGVPIREITCPTHRVDIDYQDSSNAAVWLNSAQQHEGNRDFILKYRLCGSTIESGLLLYEGKTENFFLAMIQPPARVVDRQIPPREYIFIVDVSGSMHGFPLTVSKKLLNDLIGNLRPSDRFNVLLFAGGSSLLADTPLPATAQNVKKALRLIDRQRGGGGTRLLPALKRAFSLPSAEDISRSVVIVTDGYVTVEKEAFELIRNHLGNTNVFTFGIGSSVNRYLIEGMARVGMGEPSVVTEPAKAEEAAARFRKLIQTPVLTGITMDFGAFDVYDVEPRTIPDVMAERPVVVFGKWRGARRGCVTVEGATGGSRFIRSINVSSIAPKQSNGALRYLWARHRIALLSDYGRRGNDKETVREVTSLGLTYELMTPFTSFVAVDCQVRNPGERPTSVTQPLPLPQGVSDLAVGRSGYGYQAKPSACLAASVKSVKKRSEAEGDVSFEKGDHRTSNHTRKSLWEVRRITLPSELPKKQLTAFLEKKRARIDLCLARILSPKKRHMNQILIRLEVNMQGRVVTLEATRNTGRDTTLESCMLRIFKSFSFSGVRLHKKGTITILICTQK